ncbi:MAG: lantibiotic dehydratase [Acidobacteriota bacterium]
MSRSRKMEPWDLAVLRTPLLPFEEVEAWSAGLRTPDCRDEDLEEALAHDRALLRGRLEALLERPEVREALFLASPDLTGSLPQWRREPESKKGRRTEHGLVRYFLRMATRPTPFGLFSGCTAGTVGPADGGTRLELAERGVYGRHSRLDMDYLFALCEHLGRDSALRSELLYRPNTSLYEAAGRYRYAEARVIGRLRTYHLVAVDVFDALRETLERAADGARLGDLAEALVAGDPDGEITLEDAAAFLDELVDSQMLVPDLELPVTGEESTPGLLRQLEGLAPAAEARERLARAERELAALDARGIGGTGNDPDAYRAIAADLEPLGAPVELSRLVQVDMIKPGREVRLGRDVMDEILRGVEVLHRLHASVAEGPMEDFRNAFRERYGEGREMPLATVLDEESGIGFGRSGRAAAEASPLLEGLPLSPAEERMQVPWSRRNAMLLRLLETAVEQGKTELELTEEHLSRMEQADRKPLPDAFHCMATLVARSPEELEAGGPWRLLLEHAVGPSGARLHGRFCHADERIHAGVRSHLAAEEAHVPEAVFAEVVHLPAGRVGNVLARPVLRSHEIVFLGRSGAPRERQIRIDDLTVTVEGGRIRLRSRSLDREVIPRLSTAHNPAAGGGGLGLYRFLAAIQGQQQTSALMWSWGLLESAPFLPRITHGRLVLSRACWRIAQEEFKAAAAARGADRLRLARRLRQERRLPRLALLVDGDNELLLDFDNPLSLDAVLDLVRNRPEILLMEVFPSPDELCARGPEGRFFHEVLVGFTRSPGERSALSARRLPAPPGPLVRTFAPGSEWLFAKLYTGTATGDQALRDEIAPLAREALASGDARSWFFLRYGDPDWHLRVRFHGAPARLLGNVLPRLEEAFRRLQASGAAWKLQLDTYEREIERYGGPGGIELSEELFFHDSEAVAAIVESLASDTGADLRWRLMLLGMDRMMEDFGYDLEGRQRLAEACRTAFAGRYRQDVLRGPVADRLRKERPALERLLATREDEELQPALDALGRRSAALDGLVRELRARELQGRLRSSVEDILPSYLHMFVNRLSRSSGPEHEMVLYDFLAQIYGSLRARARSRSSAPAGEPALVNPR